MTPEGKVKVWVHKLMSEWFPEAFMYAPPGVHRFGNNGMPDRMYFIGANDYLTIVVAIETKAEGGTPTALQMKKLKILKSQGAISAVVTGKDKIRMEAIRREILRRIQLANEEPRTEAIPTSDRDD